MSLIKRAKGSILSFSIKSGVNFSIGKAVYINNGEADLADKDLDKKAYGFVRDIQGSTVIVQTDGVLPTSSSVGKYWLSTSGDITQTVPSSGTLQEVAMGLTGNKIMITIDTTTIKI